MYARPPEFILHANEIRDAGCSRLLRFKESRIPAVYVEYGKLRSLEGNYQEKKYPFHFLTDLPVTERSVKELSETGRRRWAFENEG